MIVNAFLIFGFDLVPVDSGSGVQPHGHIANEVLDENRVFIGPLRDGFFVLPLEKGVHFTGSAGLDLGNQIFNPNGLLRSNADSHFAALIVGSIFGNRLGTGTKRRDIAFDRENKIQLRAPQGGIKADGVIHQTLLVGNRGLFDQEEGKFHFEMGIGCIQPQLHGPQDLGNVLNVNDISMFIENLNETAHVRSLKLFRQVDEKTQCGDCILERLVAFVTYLDRESKASDAYLINGQLTEVRLTLFVGQTFSGHSGNNPEFLRDTCHG